MKIVLLLVISSFLQIAWAKPFTFKSASKQWVSVEYHCEDNNNTMSIVLSETSSGKLIKVMRFPDQTAKELSCLSLGKFSAVDLENKGYVDFIFFGDNLGQLWKMDLRNMDPKQWHLSNSMKPFFRLPFDINNNLTITQAPLVISNINGEGIRILFWAVPKVVDASFTAYFFSIIDDLSKEENEIRLSEVFPFDNGVLNKNNNWYFEYVLPSDNFVPPQPITRWNKLILPLLKIEHGEKIPYIVTLSASNGHRIAQVNMTPVRLKNFVQNPIGKISNLSMLILGDNLFFRLNELWVVPLVDIGIPNGRLAWVRVR